MARTQGQIPLTFFKPIYGKNFDKLLYIPPSVAPLISELNGRKTYLNDSSGRKWEVLVSEVDGLLAFHQGWNDFFTGHDLEYGDFLVFLYTGKYFHVEVYNKSAIQRFKFQSSSQTKNRTRMDQQCSNPLNGFTELNNIRSVKKEKSRKSNMESDDQGKKSSARRLSTRNGKSQLKRDDIYREKRKGPRFQDQSQSNRDQTKTNCCDPESSSIYCSRNDRSDSERNTVENDDFEETLPHFHSHEGQPQFKRGTNGDRERHSLYRGSKDRFQSKRTAVEIDDFEETAQFKRQKVERDGGNRENPSVYRGSKDGSESGRNNVEIDEFEESSQFKRQDAETDVGDTENSSRSCIKKAEIQPKREIFEDSFFGFAWEEVKNTHNEVRTAVLDLSEFEVWGGCCTNQSAGIKAAAVRSGFGDIDQGTSSRDVRTNETNNGASEVAAKVEGAGEMFGYKSNSDAPVATNKEKCHILSGDHPREPTYVPVSAKKYPAHMMPAGYQVHEHNKRVPLAVSGAAMPVIKKERMGADAVPFNLVKNQPTAQGAAVPLIKKERMGADAMPFNLTENKPTAQGAAVPVIKKEGMQTGGAAVPVIKKEGMGADTFRFNLTKNTPTALEKLTISAKTEAKVETFTDWSLEPLRAIASNLSFLELPLELPGETLQCTGVTQRVVILQDSCKRLYSVIYYSDTTRKVLSRGWDKFCKVNGVQLGDECIFRFRGKLVYAVSVVKKQSIT